MKKKSSPLMGFSTINLPNQVKPGDSPPKLNEISASFKGKFLSTEHVHYILGISGGDCAGKK